MIEIKNLVKRYGKNYAVKDISFTVNDGEIIGFLGPNGAGKSTTMNILTGYLSATEGTCLIGGADILENPAEAKKKIGFLPEQPPLYLDMTVREYLNFVYDLKRCTLNRKAHIDEICDVIKIKDVEGRLIKNLSKGYRQRVGIAQALIGDPEILIFDEPTVGLDPMQIIEIRYLIKSLGRSHTVILSTHILPEVQAVCDRIIVINKGEIVADKTAQSLEDITSLENRYRVKVSGASEKAVKDALEGVTGVASVEVEDSSGTTATFIIRCEKDTDAGANIFSALSSKGIVIHSYEPCSANLEDVFISLVSGSSSNSERKGK